MYQYTYKKLADGTKKQINATISAEDYELIDNFCKDNDMSKAQFIIKSCKYIIENNIDLKSEE